MTPWTLNQRMNTRVVWLLALVLVAQALFPLQLHTTTAKDANGQTVVICTLQGYKAVQVDASGQLVDADSAALSNPHDSAAWAFSQLMGGAMPLPEMAQVSGPAPTAAVLPEYHYSYTPSPYQQLRSIRAPPVLS